MQTKLTLRLKQGLIVSAKHYAEQTGTSVSQVVADYFQALQQKAPVAINSASLPPLTQALKGVLKLKMPLDKKDYRKYLEEKYL